MSARKVWLGVASVLTTLTAGLACFVHFRNWEPQAPFDVLGILWLLSNLPNLLACLGVILLLALALTAWVKVLLAPE